MTYGTVVASSQIGLTTIIEQLEIGTKKAHRLFLQLKAKGKIYSAYRPDSLNG